MSLVTFSHWGPSLSAVTAICNPGGLWAVLIFRAVYSGCGFQGPRHCLETESRREGKFPGRGEQIPESLRCSLACGKLRHCWCWFFYVSMAFVPWGPPHCLMASVPRYYECDHLLLLFQVNWQESIRNSDLLLSALQKRALWRPEVKIFMIVYPLEPA